MGRWMSADWADKPEAVPYSILTDPQSLNLYSYVRNHPITSVDADGHCPEGDDVCIATSDTMVGTPFHGLGLGELLAGVITDLVNMMPRGDCGHCAIPPDAATPRDSQAQQAGGIVLMGLMGPKGASAAVEDATAAALQKAATSADSAVAPGGGAVRGTLVHSEFERNVNNLKNPNLSTEVSYKNGSVVPRGTAGSIRADVVEGSIHKPQVIHDLKTGGARLTPQRIKQIQSHVPGGAKVPVKEIKP